MAHSGPSRACASFVPPMSVRIFGHFEQFSTFSARRAPCSAPSCTPDAWTNGPYMTWVLWILVPMVRTQRWRSGATCVKVLAQGECGRFCHFGNCGPNLDCHHAEWHGDLWKPRAWESLLDSPLNCVRDGRSDLQAGVEIYHWEYPGFWLILSSQNDPLLGPLISPPRVVHWRPHISMPIRSPDSITSCTLRGRSQVYPPIL